MSVAWYRKRRRENFKRRDDNFRRDHGGRHEPFIVQERPYGELNRYQKKLIIVVCRMFAKEGDARLCEELDKLQYCSLETALRVAREGGYEPQKNKEEDTMPKAIMSEDTLLDIIRMYNDGVKPAELAERFGFDVTQINNKLARAKIHSRYKYLFTDKTEKTTDEQDKRFEEILDSVNAGAKKPEEPEQTENDIDRAADAIDNYLSEKNLTADMNEEKEQQHPKVFTATGEGLIEAVDGMLLIEGQDISKAISEQLAENFIGTFYGSVTIHFEVLPERKVLRFNVG